MSKLLKLLQRLPLFQGMEEKELNQMVCFLEEEKFDMEEDILVEYESDQDIKMYIILDGGVEVLKKAPSKDEEEIHLNLLRPGESFGEMGLVDVMVRSATVRAVAPTRALSLSKWNLNRLFDLHPRAYAILMKNIAKQISRRLRRADVLQASMMYKEQVQKEQTKKEKIEAELEVEVPGKEPIDFQKAKMEEKEKNSQKKDSEKIPEE